MEKENKDVKITEEIIEDEAVVETEEVEEVPETEEKDSENNEDVTEEELIEEFAPSPITIPNYNKEKEQKKRDKARVKEKNSNSKKSRKRKNIIRKIMNVVRAIVLSILLLVVGVASMSALNVRVNTSEYATNKAIRKHDPSSFVVGKIKNPIKLHLQESSENASVTDILKDNAIIPVTYKEIVRAVNKSTYPDFVASVAHDVTDFYLYGKSYKGISDKKIADMLYKNASDIQIITGQKLSESACLSYAKSISKSMTVKEIDPSVLPGQKAIKYTYITSIVFSYPALIAFIVLLLILIVLTILACSGYSHKIIGWTLMLSGIATGVMGYLVKPMFKAVSPFVKSVLDALTQSFNANSVIFGVVVLVIGLLIRIIGGLMVNDTPEEIIVKDDYIDELDQTTVVQL